MLVLGCSAGGFRMLLTMLKALPANLPVGVLVVIHRNANYETHLEANLAAKCRIVVKVAEDKEPIRPATAYFAPAGYHLLVEPDRSLSLDTSEPVHFCRPSIDVTMQSAADVYGASTVAILLSGANQDGAEGMESVRKVDGLCIVQHPRDAEVETMPAAAIRKGAVDLTLTNGELIILSQGLSNHIFRN
ncbi:chemotaxis protein CheB [Parapedobacter sp. 2B3]|uniref:chemotaxis protein CheB n=1 Tax=Parapedobacter sp. 2B3 TaxID=3342381 RepID=UPI0035B5B824